MVVSWLSSFTVRVVVHSEGNHRSQEWAGISRSQPFYRDVKLCMRGLPLPVLVGDLFWIESDPH